MALCVIIETQERKKENMELEMERVEEQEEDAMQNKKQHLMAVMTMVMKIEYV